MLVLAPEFFYKNVYPLLQGGPKDPNHIPNRENRGPPVFSAKTLSSAVTKPIVPDVHNEKPVKPANSEEKPHWTGDTFV